MVDGGTPRPGRAPQGAAVTRDVEALVAALGKGER
jgi:hypothetical protein